MISRSFWISLAASALSFIAGFLLANALNRRELAARPPVSVGSKPAANGNGAEGVSLTSEEIKQKIAAADANPGDFTFQKSLGVSLYRYSALKQDASILPDALRIMERALHLQPADRDLQIAIGNACFDQGYLNKDNAGLVRSREFYRKALASKPGDADVRTDLALSFLLFDPPDYASAVAEFETALASNPRQERALQFLTQTYIKQNDSAKAAATLEKLKKVNPQNASISEFSSMPSKSGQDVPK